MNLLNVAIVAARTYQLTTDETKDSLAQANAKKSVEAAMISMAYEQSKQGSSKILKAIDEVKEATKRFSLVEDRKKKNEKEMILAENSCVIGQAGSVTQEEAAKEEEEEIDLKKLSIPA